MVQREFRAVQLVADAFFSFLAFQTLSTWIGVLALHSWQSCDVIVFLAAVGSL